MCSTRPQRGGTKTPRLQLRPKGGRCHKRSKRAAIRPKGSTCGGRRRLKMQRLPRRPVQQVEGKIVVLTTGDMDDYAANETTAEQVLKPATVPRESGVRCSMKEAHCRMPCPESLSPPNGSQPEILVPLSLEKLLATRGDPEEARNPILELGGLDGFSQDKANAAGVGVHERRGWKSENGDDTDMDDGLTRGDELPPPKLPERVNSEFQLAFPIPILRERDKEPEGSWGYLYAQEVGRLVL